MSLSGGSTVKQCMQSCPCITTRNWKICTAVFLPIFPFLSPSGDLGIGLVWDNLSPPHPTWPDHFWSLNWSQIFYRDSQMGSRCAQMFSDVHRCFQMISFWIFSRYSIVALLMFSKCSLDVLRIFAGFFQDVFRMLRWVFFYINVFRSSQIFWIFPRFSIYVLLMFSRCSQDVQLFDDQLEVLW